MSKAGKILSVSPTYALPGGEVIIECEGFELNNEREIGCFFEQQKARIVGASSRRIIAIVPEDLITTDVEIHLKNGADKSNSVRLTVGKKIADELHIVANPAVDPHDDSIILTRSGSRGQSLPVTLYRLETDGYLQEMSAVVMNPTGIAFDSAGHLFVTNRSDGEVYRINREDEAVAYAQDLGVATGIAFDADGLMYVGDRRGNIYKISSLGIPENFAKVEPSVSAYHLAFDTQGNLLVTAPGLASFDSIYTIDKLGKVREYFRGLGRPQGLAFDRSGNLYLSACLRGQRGIVKINSERKAELFVAGMNVIGLCFNRKGEMIVATNEAVYSLSVSLFGTIL